MISTGILLPTIARVSPLTYSAEVATRYVAVCAEQAGKWAMVPLQGEVTKIPSGFQTILWHAGWNRNGPGCAYAVSSMLRTNESLYIMYNNLEDVNTLEGDFLMKAKEKCGVIRSLPQQAQQLV